ncbi:MAG TPA: hypothetical protein VFP31_03940 [Gaiellaceae bacterium]|nr:hypothetical protein [Gaiellaceae bacterium]
MTADRSTWLPLGELLVERRLLSQRQLDLALQEHARTGRRLGEVLVSFGFVSEQALAATLLEQVGLMDSKVEPEPAAEPEPEREPEPAPALRTAGHLSEAEPEPERPIVVRIEDLPAPRPAPSQVGTLEAQVADFERRSEEIQASIAQIRGVLAELQG